MDHRSPIPDHRSPIPDPRSPITDHRSPKILPTRLFSLLSSPKTCRFLSNQTSSEGKLGDKHVTPSQPKTVDYPTATRYLLAAMKTLIPLTALAALVASSSIHAQTPAFSKPSGYVSQSLIQGFNPIGLNLQLPATTSGTFTAVGSSSVTDSTKNFSTILTDGALYLLEIGSGSQINRIVEASEASSTELNTADNLSAAGVVIGDSYVLRKAATLEEIFGTTNSVLQKNNAVGNADVVHVPNGTGGYIRYFQNAAGAWRNATTPGFAPNTPVVYIDAVFIERKSSTPVTLTITGQVKTTASKTTIVTGFNFVSTIYPAGATLQNSGLADSLTKNNAVGNADVVHVPNGTGGYTRFFVNAAGVWRNATTPGFAPNPQPITSAIFIERKGASTAINHTAPSSYLDL